MMWCFRIVIASIIALIPPVLFAGDYLMTEPGSSFILVGTMVSGEESVQITVTQTVLKPAQLKRPRLGRSSFTK